MYTFQPAILSRYPALGSVEREVLERLVSRASVARLPEGTRVFASGGDCSHYLLLLEGSVRVQKISESGREIVLYRMQPGETCILTTACLLSNESYGAEAIAESEVSALAIPKSAFHEAVARSASFREFVFRVYSQRIGDLLMLVEEVAFGRMDARLAHKLLLLSGGAAELEMTHQQLASELGTHREVVSRLLKEMERAGALSSGRGHIFLKDKGYLARLAGGAAM